MMVAFALKTLTLKKKFAYLNFKTLSSKNYKLSVTLPSTTTALIHAI
jgi:hypothetical protein